MAHDLVKVGFIVQLDGRMLRFLPQVKLYYHWHYLASILLESQLLWQVDLKIRALHPANPVYMAWTNRDQHSTMFANVIPTEQYNLKNEELWCAASTSLGISNPVCIPHIGTSLVRNAPEEDEDDADTAQRGDEVDPFGQNVSAIVLVTGKPMENSSRQA